MLLDQSFEDLLDHESASLVALYQHLHANPELSHYEEKTAALVARELDALGYAVTAGIGKYQRPEWRGHGVAATLTNGTGPTVLIRADMDALPVTEQTGLPYASRVVGKTESGQEVGVMHACGHDIHVTCLLGTARMLADLRDDWRGTLLLIGQPAEETCDGAQAMLEDGLYDRFPVPDYALALHDNAQLAAGKIGYTPGYFLATLNSVDITVRGVGGHGSRPEQAKDPIVLAAQIVTALQTIVSREISPLDPAVVSIGSIHGGTRYNIIPDEVRLQVTVRAYREEVRQKILAAIERITVGIARAAGMPETQLPTVAVNPTEVAPATYNHPELMSRLAETFTTNFGESNVLELPPIMGSEDFGRFGLEGHQIPTSMFWIGAVDPLAMENTGEEDFTLPPLHSSRFAPLPAPTIRTGVKAMTAAALELLQN
jgi:hippurate hydrolase